VGRAHPTRVGVASRTRSQASGEEPESFSKEFHSEAEGGLSRGSAEVTREGGSPISDADPPAEVSAPGPFQRRHEFACRMEALRASVYRGATRGA
jgi:hypothetical protein